MTAQPGPGLFIGRHVLGLVAFAVIGLIVAFLWLWFTTRVLGVGRTGFGNATAIIMMPLWGIGMGLLVWLPWWLLHRRKWGNMSAGRALISGALAGLLVSLLLTGPRGFTTQGGAVLMAYAVILIGMLGAFAHNALLRRASN